MECKLVCLEEFEVVECEDFEVEEVGLIDNDVVFV